MSLAFVTCFQKIPSHYHGMSIMLIQGKLLNCIIRFELEFLCFWEFWFCSFLFVNYMAYGYHISVDIYPIVECFLDGQIIALFFAFLQSNAGLYLKLKKTRGNRLVE